MVLLSEIIKGKDRGRSKISASAEKSRNGRLWLSDSQLVKKEEINELHGTAQKDATMEKVKTIHHGLLENATAVRDRVIKNEKLEASDLLSLLQSVISEDLVDELYEYGILKTSDEDLPRHILAVTLGSLKVGKGLGYEAKDLLKVGVAAFLENVGMYKIPESILRKKEELTRDEMDIILKHPETSARILDQLSGSFQWVSEEALQAHERSDGSGYPKGLKGKEISEIASIIGIMDTYMAMIQNRPYRKKIIQTDVVKYIIGPGKGKFPPRVVKAFLDQISLFPLNTYVRLNNDTIGRVVSTDKSQPLRPTVEIWYDAVGQKMNKPKTIRLSHSPLLHIVGPIDERNLR